jgi:hypothetical protein
MLSMSSVAVATFISCVREFGWKSFRVDVGGDDPLEAGTRGTRHAFREYMPSSALLTVDSRRRGRGVFLTKMTCSASMADGFCRCVLDIPCVVNHEEIANRIPAVKIPVVNVTDVGFVFGFSAGSFLAHRVSVSLLAEFANDSAPLQMH